MNATGTTATAGCATRPSPCGACTRSASIGRPTTSCSSSPTSSATGTARLQIMYGLGGERDLTERILDHLTRLRGGGPGPGRQRRLPAEAERRLRLGARLGLPAHQDGRSHPAAALAGDPGPGHVARSRSGTSPTRGSGKRARSAEALRVLEADVLGRESIAAPAWPSARASRSSPRSGRRSPTRSARTSLPAASQSAASSASTTTPTRSTPRRC